jgi:hypothetical protein
MKKILILAGVAVVAVVMLVGGFFILNSYIYQEKQDGTNSSVEPYRAILSGEYVCLPHADKSGPETMECAFGIRTDLGEYFAVDFSLMSETNPGIEVGERFSANGTVTPIEMLSAYQWQKYDVVGIFSVTDSVEVEGEIVGGGEPVFCTMDAKMCPDGSYVGRQGPNCEFAACPGPGAMAPAPSEPVACTMEAKICPDGSAVGRQGPNCEFALCPGEVQ